MHLFSSRRADRFPLMALYQKSGNTEVQKCMVRVDRMMIGDDIETAHREAEQMMISIGKQYAAGDVDEAGLYPLRDRLLRDFRDKHGMKGFAKSRAGKQVKKKPAMFTEASGEQSEEEPSLAAEIEVIVSKSREKGMEAFRYVGM